MNRIQIKIIKDALDQPEALTEWEYDFVNNLADKDDDYRISEKQNKILNKIGCKLK